MEGFRELVFKMLSVADELNFGNMTLWSIWRECNNQVSNSKHSFANCTARAGLEVLCEWVAV